MDLEAGVLGDRHVVLEDLDGQPDPDGGDVDGSAEYEVALVVAGGHRSVALELVDGALNDVALLVALDVEMRRSATLAAALEPVELVDQHRTLGVARWSDGSGMVAVIRRRRRWKRIATEPARLHELRSQVYDEETALSCVLVAEHGSRT